MFIKVKEKIILFDKDDYDKILKYTSWNLNHGYVISNTYLRKDGRGTLMHHLILPKKDGFEIDHINGNGLDNRRKNLRYVTSSQNKMNTAIRCDNKSGYKGVYFNNYKKRWMAEIMINSKKIVIGQFINLKEQSVIYLLLCQGSQ